jgi:hypothetical protein
MSTPSKSQPAVKEGAEEVLLEWSVNLGAIHPRKRAVAGWVTVGAALASSLVFGPLYGILALLLLTASVSELFWPVKYRLTSRRAIRKAPGSLIEMEWSRVRKLYRAADGLKLSPFAKPTRLEPFRGIYIRCLPENRDRVIELVKELSQGEGKKC